MQELRVGLITVFHVNDIVPDCQNLPRIVRTRDNQEKKTRELHGKGIVRAKENYRDRPIFDTGVALARQRQKILSGEDVAPHLEEPRMVYIPDEESPKAKWKTEFRKKWHTSEGAMGEVEREVLISALRQSLLQIAGLWLNPNIVNGRRDGAFWLNVVLSVCRIPNARPDAGIRFASHSDGLWAYW